MTRSAVPPPVTAVIDAAGAWLPARMDEVERELDRVTEGEGGPLADGAASTLAAGGKRLRPLLVLVCGGESAGAAAVPAAVAVELVHMATLVHDDVLDAAPTRRGRPTVVAQAGRDRATAVGDFVFARAFAELARDGAERQIEILAGASVSLALGELAQRRDAYDTGVSEESYMRRCELKTGRLFEAACLLGRIAAAQPGAEALGRFGSEIGLAFQLLDDVLDVAGPPERTGKARGADLLDGTVTLPLILAARRDPELAVVELRGLDASEAERICDRIAATGALDEVRDRAQAGVARAKATLESDQFTAAERHHLGLVATGVVERYS
jgi:geranylgeranyl pyrophosphate synthase